MPTRSIHHSGFHNERRSFMDGRRGETGRHPPAALAFPLRVDGPVLEHVADRLEGLADDSKRWAW